MYRTIVTPTEDEGIETAVGVMRDNTFGPTVMFGLEEYLYNY